MIYVIQAGDGGPVKIGIAADPAKRLADLQTAHYETLRILHVWQGGRSLEKALHKSLAGRRIRGEWFNPTPDLLDGSIINAIQAPPPAPMVASLLAEMGTVADVGQALGVPANTVATWKKRSRIPAAWWSEVAALAAARGISGVTPRALKAQAAAVGAPA